MSHILYFMRDITKPGAVKDQILIRLGLGASDNGRMNM
jgi:hypothetical protein